MLRPLSWLLCLGLLPGASCVCPAPGSGSSTTTSSSTPGTGTTGTGGSSTGSSSSGVGSSSGTANGIATFSGADYSLTTVGASATGDTFASHELAALPQTCYEEYFVPQ